MDHERCRVDRKQAFVAVSYRGKRAVCEQAAQSAGIPHRLRTSAYWFPYADLNDWLPKPWLAGMGTKFTLANDCSLVGRIAPLFVAGQSTGLIEGPDEHSNTSLNENSLKPLVTDFAH
jgi:hypothetical protein